MHETVRLVGRRFYGLNAVDKTVGRIISDLDGIPVTTEFTVLGKIGATVAVMSCAFSVGVALIYAFSLIRALVQLFI